MQTLIEIENEKLSNETLDNQAVNIDKHIFHFISFIYSFLVTFTIKISNFIRKINRKFFVSFILNSFFFLNFLFNKKDEYNDQKISEHFDCKCLSLLVRNKNL
jgi:hypothetical protein